MSSAVLATTTRSSPATSSIPRASFAPPVPPARITTDDTRLLCRLMERFEGRTALVTGGAGGIGSATVRRLAAEGARVAVADLDEEGARAIAGEVDGVAVTLDVTDVESVRAGVSRAAEELGGLQVLVNNAGTDRFAFFTQSDPELWDFVLGVNLRGVLAVTHAALPHLQER